MVHHISYEGGGGVEHSLMPYSQALKDVVSNHAVLSVEPQTETTLGCVLVTKAAPMVPLEPLSLAQPKATPLSVKKQKFRPIKKGHALIKAVNVVNAGTAVSVGFCVKDRGQRKCLFPIAAQTLQQDSNIIFSQFVCFLVVRLLNLELSALLLPTRGTAKAAFSRQLAMYLCHVIGQQSQASIGGYFSRDRKTVSHACEVIEDMREDDRFNDELERVEAMMSVILEQLKTV